MKLSNKQIVSMFVDCYEEYRDKKASLSIKVIDSGRVLYSYADPIAFVKEDKHHTKMFSVLNKKEARSKTTSKHISLLVSEISGLCGVEVEIVSNEQLVKLSK